MPQYTQSLSRDGNGVPVQTWGFQAVNSKTLTGNNTTVNVPVFHVVGSVFVNALYGVITTDLGANHTAAYFRLNDQTAQVNITLNTGTALSAAKAGSVIAKSGLAAAAVTLISNSAGRINEPTTLETVYFSPFTAVKKTAATTDIEYTYSTTDAPTSGVIQFFAQFMPLSADGNLVVI